jgi:hypothetical protein
MRRGRRALVVLLALGVALAAAPHARSFEALDLPLEHWSYEFLERLVVRATLERRFLDLRPITRGEAADLVRRLDAAVAAGTWSPSGIEARQLAMLGAEFSEELAARGVPRPLERRAYHVWERAGWKLQAFWQARERFDQGRALPDGPVQLDGRVALEPAAALLLGDRVLAAMQLSYRVRTGDAALLHSTDPRDGEAQFVFQPTDRFAITRTVEPALRYAGERFRVDLSRTRLRWGPGRHDAMLLQDGLPPLDALRAQVDLGRVRFASVLGQLRPARLAGDTLDVRERWLAAHRLSCAPHRRLQLAFSEALVWGDRGLDLAYANPLAVLFVTQANVGDRDNALASVDASLLLGDGLELYGECVFDDLNLRRGLRHYGNKLGVLAGFLWLQPLGARDWDVDGEWSWASEYTYTHFRQENRYEHFGASLGSRIGPDADLWVLGIRRRWTRGWSARLFYELERHGRGQLGRDQEQRTSDRQDYLSGRVESRHQPGIEVRYRGLRRVDLELDARYQVHERPGLDPARVRTPRVRLQVRLEL